MSASVIDDVIDEVHLQSHRLYISDPNVPSELINLDFDHARSSVAQYHDNKECRLLEIPTCPAEKICGEEDYSSVITDRITCTIDDFNLSLIVAI